MCIGALSVCMPMHYVCAVPQEARRGRQKLWNWSFRQLVVNCHVGASNRTREEQPVLVTKELFLQPLVHVLMR